MALTGIQIFKLLPKKNCKECGVPTCLAFAMALAAGKAEIDSCPYISDEARAQLTEASAPPIRPVTIGTSDRKLTVGGETVMFRHEKRFENPTGLAMLLTDAMETDEINARLQRAKLLQYERVGMELCPELIAIKSVTGNAEAFAELAHKVKEQTDFSIILMSLNPDILRAGIERCAERKPLLYAATADNYQTIAALSKDYSLPVVVLGTSLEEAADLSIKLEEAGVKDIVLDSGARTVKQVYQDQVITRGAALAKRFKPLGYPTIAFPCEMTDNPMKEAVIASTLMAKYASILVLSDFRGESLFPLLVERMNIYTDPQRPLATTEGIYEINDPDENSPVFITSNFSLTYFIVSGEIESSKLSGYLLVKDTEGLSVLTAWAAGKFVADTIAPFIKKSGIEDRISHRKLIIPGYIASESGSIEEELANWQVEVGPREAAHLPAFLKATC